MNRGTAFPTILHVPRAKTQISLRIHAGWSESSLSVWRRLVSSALPQITLRRLWSDRTNVQADLNLRWAQMNIVGNAAPRLISLHFNLHLSKLSCYAGCNTIIHFTIFCFSCFINFLEAKCPWKTTLQFTRLTTTHVTWMTHNVFWKCTYKDRQYCCQQEACVCASVHACVRVCVCNCVMPEGLFLMLGCFWICSNQDIEH